MRLQPGDIAPDFILPDVDGRCVRLYSELERGPVVLVSYRGGWCPYCKIHLRGFQKSLADYKRGGAQVMGISPQWPDHSLVTRETTVMVIVLQPNAIATMPFMFAASRP